MHNWKFLMIIIFKSRVLKAMFIKTGIHPNHWVIFKSRFPYPPLFVQRGKKKKYQINPKAQQIT